MHWVKGVAETTYAKSGVASASRSSEERRLTVGRLRQANGLLSCMPDAMFDLLVDHLVPVRLPPGAILFEPLAPVRTAYFLMEGLIAAARLMEDGSSVQLAMGGRGGFAGVSVLTGAEFEETQSRVVIPGSALSINADKLRAIMAVEPALRAHLQRFVSMLMSQVGLSTSCNVRHSAGQRLARWLLTAKERTGSPELAVGQETIALLLGIRRTGVSEILGQFRDAGLVVTGRNQVTIKDERGLENRSCECFREGEAARRRHSHSPADSALQPSEIHALLDRYFQPTSRSSPQSGAAKSGGLAGGPASHPR